MEGDAVAVVVGDDGCALQAGEGNEAVLGKERTTDGGAGGEDVDHEIGAVDHAYNAVRWQRIVGAIVGIDIEINGIARLERVELTRLAIEAETVVVEETVGDIGTLLDLAHHDASADGVYASGRDEEDIAGMHLVTCKNIDNRAVVNTLGIVVLRDLLLETYEHGGSWVGLHDVPHLCLAERTVTLVSQFVVGMHLYGEVAGGIDELDEQRQLGAIVLEDAIAEEYSAVLDDEAVDAASYEMPIAHVRLAGRHITDLPTLADGLLVGLETLEGSEFVAAPHEFVEVGLEEERIHF